MFISLHTQGDQIVPEGKDNYGHLTLRRWSTRSWPGDSSIALSGWYLRRMSLSFPLVIQHCLSHLWRTGYQVCLMLRDGFIVVFVTPPFFFPTLLQGGQEWMHSGRAERSLPGAQVLPYGWWRACHQESTLFHRNPFCGAGKYWKVCVMFSERKCVHI